MCVCVCVTHVQAFLCAFLSVFFRILFFLFPENIFVREYVHLHVLPPTACHDLSYVYLVFECWHICAALVCESTYLSVYLPNVKVVHVYT